MRSTSKFAIALVGLTILIIALIDVVGNKPIDWRKTYDQRDKIPFGLYITHQQLPDFLNNGTTVTDFVSTNYRAVDSLLSGKNAGTVVYIENQLYDGKQTIDRLYAFVRSGGEVFISANKISEALLDTLGIKQSYYYPSDFGSVLDDERTFKLADGGAASYADLTYPGVFWDLDSAQVKILGYFEVEDKNIPNFITVQVGKGRFVLHLEPVMFTNYFMLKKDNFNYGVRALRFISNKNIYWYDGNFKTDQRSRSPLRVFLENKSLRQGWYLILFGLILFLLFKSKREQRAIAIIQPEPNLSKDFARTISALYYENGKPGNLIVKKIEYFLYDLRMHFQLDIMQIDDSDFPRQLSQRAGTDEQDAEHIISVVKRYRHASDSTDKELIMVNKEIEEFKRKAHMQ
ncbi:DUF4350 domain-containing protein [Sphingobacterium shayense]|uniref:DUF4350 domain-containing protein n=1 Tax=Sphingobacterium shayense TaxID=626343 RepID=UPI001554911E|nr:DUF4350 domain-containing protein [Sphingobacterium shayense]NQD72504.1 DUF4350 domain-containing protein [Sphingobacterium shayense]